MRMSIQRWPIPQRMTCERMVPMRIAFVKLNDMWAWKTDSVNVWIRFEGLNIEIQQDMM